MGFRPVPRRAFAAFSCVLRGSRGRASLASVFLLTAALLIAGFVALGARSAPAARAATAPVGQDFTLTTGDLHFILHQIQIAEHHAATVTPSNQCGTLVGPGPDQIPDRLSSYGLRTTDGSCNNLFPGRENFAAANQPFPRLATPAAFQSADRFDDPDLPFPVGPPGQTSTYDSTAGNVVDGQVRTASNLIVDQTSTNPAAVAAANFPVRTQGAKGANVCSDPPSPHDAPDCVTLAHKTLFIPNVTTDVGLSPPYNSWFTFFGQFFDHGVDQTSKSGGTVFVPLKADDPLITVGPDGIKGTNCGTATAKNCDEVPPSQAFMVLTRAQNQPGPDGVLGDNPATPQDESADDVQNANNTDTPWVDQSQTYSSHPSHQ